MVALLFVLAALAQGAVQLAVDSSEAEKALGILHRQADGQPVVDSEWQTLFATLPYQQLKAREASMGRAFSDDEFRKFLTSADAVTKMPEWERSLASFKQANLPGIAERTLEWLPKGASFRARVFPLVKPQTNSFVWGEDRAIFLYLSDKTRGQFENTVAHECHHIGLDSVQKEAPNKAVKFLGAFGEGEAMLAAAGSVDRHPHAEDDALARAQWDADLMHFNADVAALQTFFIELFDGKFKDDDAIMKRAAPFWGAQGAWYTVGYEMAVLVERRFGRQSLLDAMLDPRQLLVLYNKVALESKAGLAVWPPQFLARFNSTSN